MIHKIALGGRDRNHEAIIDAEDYERLAKYRWQVVRFNKTLFYARRRVGNYTLGMHREILKLKAGDGSEVDHINGNGLDNRKINLRIVSHKENMRNNWKRRRYNAV